MTHPALLEESVKLFAQKDRWNAFLELSSARDAIIEHWLAIGTEKLRFHLKENMPAEWDLIEWGWKTDTRLFLKEFGENSLSIGIGWRNELHLYYHRYDKNRALDRVLNTWSTPEFDELRVHFPETTSRAQAKPESLGCEIGRFNLKSTNNPTPKIEDLAWAAAHDMDDFVAATSAKLLCVPEDPELTELIRRLNTVAKPQH